MTKIRMKKIRLTESLRKHKAIIVHGDEVPEEYFEIANAFFPGIEIYIAVPEKLLNKPNLINKLSNEAVSCIFTAMQF